VHHLEIADRPVSEASFQVCQYKCVSISDLDASTTHADASGP